MLLYYNLRKGRWEDLERAKRRGIYIYIYINLKIHESKIIM